MKTLYFECSMGAAGDMLMAALLELHDNPDDFLARLNLIGLPNVNISAYPSLKHGISGTHIDVIINGKKETAESQKHSHHHNSLHDTKHLILSLNTSDTVKKNAMAVYTLIAEAESHVHAVDVNQIHFHELGEMDAVADIIGVCMLIEELAPDIILASPLNVGSGQVRCAHGVLPVPTPATAFILKNIPIYGDHISGELCTPTGAALLKHFVRQFCPMPLMCVDKLGYGMGDKDFEKVNCLRAYIGNTNSANGEVFELICNLDDMTPESIAFAQQLLLEEGAFDVYTAPIGMKKGRTGFSFTCMCSGELKEKMLSLIFEYTTTLGIREYSCRRYSLHREQSEFQTKYGKIRLKTAQGFGVKKSKPEYEDIARIAHIIKKPPHDISKEL